MGVLGSFLYLSILLYSVWTDPSARVSITFQHLHKKIVRLPMYVEQQTCNPESAQSCVCITQYYSHYYFIWIARVVHE